MAEGKKSVLLYCDLIHTIEKMDNETAGEFFKHYLRYINDLDPKTENIVVDIAFESVKQNLKRDLKKWEIRAERSRQNGQKGGRPKKVKEPRKPSGLKNNLTEPRKPVKDTVTVTDTVNTSSKDEGVIKGKTPTEILKENEIEWELFLMQNKKNVKEWELMLENYESKVDEEELPYKYRVLKGRLHRWVNSWVRIEQKEKNSEKKESNGKPKYVGGRQTEEDIIANASNWGVN